MSMPQMQFAQSPTTTTPGMTTQGAAQLDGRQPPPLSQQQLQQAQVQLQQEAWILQQEQQQAQQQAHQQAQQQAQQQAAQQQAQQLLNSQQAQVGMQTPVFGSETDMAKLYQP